MTTAADFLPEKLNLSSLQEASQGCRGCHLYERGTQTVFGEGLVRARLMLVGEQPGDQEDLAGRPFVGRAGRVLDESLVEAGIARDDAYVTNVVKHFKWTAKGKRRLHEKPNRAEIQACFPWLKAELEVVRPEVLICLGATAAQAIIAPGFRVTKSRGEFVESELARYVMATIHPSAVLRMRTSEERQAARESFVSDLRKAALVLNGSH